MADVMQVLTSEICDKLIADAQLLALVGGDSDNVMVSDPMDRPPLLETVPAIVVVRNQQENPDNSNSQNGLRNETMYIEARSWTKQTVHDLKHRIENVLKDKYWPMADGNRVHRTRHDQSIGPALNQDGSTYEVQVRFMILYENRG
jgi:hypothetical protein